MALDVDAPRPVHHDLFDGGVGEQVLQGAEADCLAQDELREPRASRRGQHGSLGRHELLDCRRDVAAELSARGVDAAALRKVAAEVGRQGLHLALVGVHRLDEAREVAVSPPTLAAPGPRPGSSAVCAAFSRR
jgi:hypothetical protein